MLLDTEGFCIPFSTDDQFIECQPDDPCFADPADWEPSREIDGERWELGPEPTQDDIEWLNTHPADDDDWTANASEQARWSQRLEELHQASEWQDRIEAMHWSNGDDDVRAAGLPVG
jgi:hypothetical protein